MAQIALRYPTPPSSSDSEPANNQQKMGGLRDISGAASLTGFNLHFTNNPSSAAHLHHQAPPPSPHQPRPNGLERGLFVEGQTRETVTREGGGRRHDGGAEQFGYPQHHRRHDYQQHAWSRPPSGSWIYPTTPPPEAESAQLFKSSNWYAPQSEHFASPSQPSLWVPQCHQPLTHPYPPAGSPPQSLPTTCRPLDAKSLPFQPAGQQQSPESVAHKSLFKRLGIDKAARYSQANQAPVPAAPVREKKGRKSKREKQLEKLAAAAAADQDQEIASDRWARAPVPREGFSEGQGPTPPAQQTGQGISRDVAKARQTKRISVMKRPTPTPLYLQNAMQPPQTGEISMPLLVILDLNGTLLFRKVYGGSNKFVARPHVYEFLEYLFSNHTVMVWSSSRPDNVAKMCSDLFTPAQQSKLAAVWGRDKLNIPANAYHRKVQVYKQLSWVWNDPQIQACNPVPGGTWSQANTVLIDDSIEKAASEPHNLIELEEFQAKPEQMKTDILGQVALYLDDLRSQWDASAYMRVKPFVYDPGPPAQVNGQEKKRDMTMEENYISFS